MDALAALTTRASPAKLGDPAPDDFDLESMLRAAVCAPDHGRLRPWRFIVVRDAARVELGEALAECLRQREPDAPFAAAEKERTKTLRAPVILIVVAAPRAHAKIPVIEQVVSAGTAAQNILLAAHAMGFGGFWRTGVSAYDERVKRVLGLSAEDTIVGFLYLGTPVVPAPPSNRPGLAEVVVEWKSPTQSQPWGT